MSTRTPAELIADYLEALDRELARAGTESEESDEIMAGVEEHIYSELAAAGHPFTVLEVEQALDRLGSPAQVARTQTEPDAATDGARQRASWTAHRAIPAAVAAVTAAAMALVWFPPFLAGALWLAGWCALVAIDVLVIASPRWHPVERGAIVALGLPAAGLGFTAVGSFSGDTIDAAGWVIAGVASVAALLALADLVVILRGLRRRAAVRPITGRYS